MAEGVADASTAHIVSLVSRQKSDTRKVRYKICNTFISVSCGTIKIRFKVLQL